MWKPIYENDEEITNLIYEISHQLSYLSTSIEKNNLIKLRKANRIKSINSSCAIEANTLREDQVTDIINGRKVIAPIQEIIEVKNAYECYDQINSFDPYNIQDFLKAHLLLTKDLIKDSGSFRFSDVAVYDEDRIIHVGARPQFIFSLVEDLFHWSSTSKTNYLIKACIVHYELEIIHPFSDGNGRIGRFWQSLILYKENQLFELIPIETLVFEHQQEYYEAIQESKMKNSATPFIIYMLQMILETINRMEHIEDTLFNIDHHVTNNLNDKEKEFLRIIVELYNENKDINTNNIVEKTQLSATSIKNYLRRFVDEGILNATGTNKGRKYFINKDIFHK